MHESQLSNEIMYNSITSQGSTEYFYFKFFEVHVTDKTFNLKQINKVIVTMWYSYFYQSKVSEYFLYQ